MTDGPGATDRLRSIVERIERVEEEIQSYQIDKREIYAEAKGAGFDVKILRKVIALRKRDAADRQEENLILATYLRALGMTPIERHIAESVEAETAAPAVAAE